MKTGKSAVIARVGAVIFGGTAMGLIALGHILRPDGYTSSARSPTAASHAERGARSAT